MKIKNGFVTNSSSTSFMFFVPGNFTFNKIEKAIKKYSGNLKTEAYEDSATQEEIVETLLDVIRTKETIKIDEQLRELKEVDLPYWEEVVEMEKAQDYVFEIIKETKERIKILEELKGRNFKRFVKVNCGDSEGDIRGRPIGNIMDYENRDWNTNQDDFVVMTEQNR